MSKSSLRPAPGRALRRVAASLAAAALLAGCAEQRFETSVAYPEVYPITVSTAPVLIAVPATGALSARDARRIDAIGRDYLRRGAGRITVAYPNDVDATETVSAVARRLDAVGVPARAIRRGAYDATRYEGEGVVVSFDGPVAAAAPCPQLWGDSVLTGENGYSARTGCAVQANLAAMVADPRDLVAPRTLGPAYSGRGVRVQGAYAAGDSTVSAQTTGDAATTD